MAIGTPAVHLVTCWGVTVTGRHAKVPPTCSGLPHSDLARARVIRMGEEKLGSGWSPRGRVAPLLDLTWLLQHLYPIPGIVELELTWLNVLKVGFNRFLCRLCSVFWDLNTVGRQNTEKYHRNFSFSRNCVSVFYVLNDDDDDDVDVSCASPISRTWYYVTII